jgi:voltage-gated potassium channel
MPQVREANFVYLLIGLLVTLLAGPVFRDFADISLSVVTQISFSATLIIGVWSLVQSRAWFIAGIALVTVEFIVTVINLVWPSGFLDVVTMSVALAFCTLSIGFAGRNVLLDEKIDTNRMMGIVCVYLLLGVLLSIINALIYKFIPNSFNGISEVGERVGVDMIYYTFVTLTTLGYGDVTPESATARAVAYLTAIIGQFYIAILVGMLVGLFLTNRSRSD